MLSKKITTSIEKIAPLRLMCIFDLNISQNVYGFIIAENGLFCFSGSLHLTGVN
jgi:hypothetical protein